jgi:hypothetical protein
MANYDDRLKDYVDVKERIRLFYQQYPDGRLVTDDIWMVQDADGTVRVWGRALAYRTPDDPLPGKGTSYMAVPGTTPYTRGSEAENVETSCWGRAIGALGIGIDKSIASAEEVQNKQGQTETNGSETLELLGRIQKTGKVAKGGAEGYRGEWRERPDGGHVIGFRLNIDGEDRNIPQVLVTGTIADQLYLGEHELLGKRITIKGHLYNVKAAGKTAYYRLVVGEHPDTEFIETPDVRIPTEGLTDEEKAAIAGSLPDEAPSEPLFPAEVAS